MNIKGSALLKAAGIGLVVTIILSLINRAIAAAYGIPSNPSTEEAMAMLSSPFMVISGVLSCISLLFDVAIGALYGWFAKRDGVAPDAGKYALGGAVTGVIVGCISSVAEVLLQGNILAGTTETLQNTPGINPESAGTILLVSVIGGVLVGMAIMAALGAVGGAIYGSIAKSRAIMNPPAA